MITSCQALELFLQIRENVKDIREGCEYLFPLASAQGSKLRPKDCFPCQSFYASYEMLHNLKLDFLTTCGHMRKYYYMYLLDAISNLLYYFIRVKTYFKFLLYLLLNCGCQNYNNQYIESFWIKCKSSLWESFDHSEKKS